MAGSCDILPMIEAAALERTISYLLLFLRICDLELRMIRNSIVEIWCRYWLFVYEFVCVCLCLCVNSSSYVCDIITWMSFWLSSLLGGLLATFLIASSERRILTWRASLVDRLVFRNQSIQKPWGFSWHLRPANWNSYEQRIFCMCK